MVKYMCGDLLKSGCNIICQQVNCQGVMGSGIAKSIRDAYPRCYEIYKDYVNIVGSEECLGTVNFFPVDLQTTIANMFAQLHYLPRGIVHTDYDAFRNCCKQIKAYVINNRLNVRIGFPDHIGCGLGGGDWDTVHNILRKEFEGDHWQVEIWKML